MNHVDRTMLRLVWTWEIGGADTVWEMSRFLTADERDGRLGRLKRAGLLADDMTLTNKGRAAIRVVLCGGVFDIIHHGHVHTLNAAKSLGDVLVVVVASDETVRKSNKVVRHDAVTRRRTVGAVGVVDVCLVGDGTDVFATVRAVRPDVIALGYDQAHHQASIEAGCRRLGLDTEVVRLRSPVPDVASSDLKKDVPLDVT